MYNEEMERLINAALADRTITDSERRALEKKAENYGIDLTEFNNELDNRLLNILIDDAMAGGKLTDRKRRELEKQAKLLGLDLDVFNLELDARMQDFNATKNKNATDALADAKAYIAEFREKLETTEVYSPTGKYGKNELDQRKTRDKKEELVLMEKPSTPERLNEFLLFLMEINNTNKISSLLNSADKNTLESPVLKETICKCKEMIGKRKKAIRRRKARRVFSVVRACLYLIACIVAYVFMWRSDMHLIWKILINIFSAPIVIAFAALLVRRIDEVID